ncbi:hypothetical protein CDAR_35101 [Caerostris darwini]|uniref:Uncharacterized protein n=1 Tax=Caerostris darwini TaxID=1538125 RepID=A0AAV4VJ67_9ARAC|nr:hypothetical protein CDAR_35101 [Caerostris darwini]
MPFIAKAGWRDGRRRSFKRHPGDAATSLLLMRDTHIAPFHGLPGQVPSLCSDRWSSLMHVSLHSSSNRPAFQLRGPFPFYWTDTKCVLTIRLGDSAGCEQIIFHQVVILNLEILYLNMK